MPRVSFVIVTYNGVDLVRRCLASLLEVDVPHETIVVDNGSADGTPEMVEREFPDVRLVRSGANLGFAGGNNLGVSLATGDYVFFLNPDTRIVGGSLAEAVGYLESHSDVGLLGPTLLNADESLQLSARNEPTLARQLFEALMLHHLSARLTRRFGEVIADAAFYASGHDVDWVCGAAMLLPRPVVDILGDMDESFFLYSEETDYCRRVREAGFRVRFEPGLRIVHEHGDTWRPHLFARSAASRLRYFAKHRSPVSVLALRVVLALNFCVRVLVRVPQALLGSQDARRRVSAFARGLRAVLSPVPKGVTP